MRNLAAAMVLAIGVAGVASAQDMDMMQFADPNSDGKVTEAEFAAFVEQGWQYIAQGGDQVKLADVDPMMKGAFTGVTPDAAGVITRTAYLAATPVRFKALDRNGDATLSAEELNAMMAPAG